MIYIETHDEWYCTECHENDLVWYPAHGSEEDRRQHDYINLYYEQKENFKNRRSSINSIFKVRLI